MPRVFASTGQRRRFLRHAGVVLLALGLFAWAVSVHLDPLRNPRSVRDFLRTLGPVSPLALIGLHAFQTVLLPIPGQVVGVAAGYLFGPFLGTVYTMTGVTIGSFAAFWLARRFGRPYLRTVFATDAVERYEATMSKLGVAGITLLVMLPGLPDDVVCFVCGTSDLSAGQFLVVVVLGRTPAYALAVFSGAEFGDEQVYRGLGLLFVLVALSVLGYLERERLRAVVLERFGRQS